MRSRERKQVTQARNDVDSIGIWRVSEDRHDPLPHIAPLTMVLKSAYRNIASLPTRTGTELRELLIPGGWEWWSPGLLFFVCGRGWIA